MLTPLGPISDPSPVVRWEPAGAKHFRIEIVDTRGFELERKVAEPTISLAALKVRLSPGRYYLTVEALDGTVQQRRTTVPFDVAQAQ